jgi:hypothetical protein
MEDAILVLEAGTGMWGNSSSGGNGSNNSGRSSTATNDYNLLAVYDGHGGKCRAVSHHSSSLRAWVAAAAVCSVSHPFVILISCLSSRSPDFISRVACARARTGRDMVDFVRHALHHHLAAEIEHLQQQQAAAAGEVRTANKLTNEDDFAGGKGSVEDSDNDFNEHDDIESNRSGSSGNTRGGCTLSSSHPSATASVVNYETDDDEEEREEDGSTAKRMPTTTKIDLALALERAFLVTDIHARAAGITSSGVTVAMALVKVGGSGLLGCLINDRTQNTRSLFVGAPPCPSLELSLTALHFTCLSFAYLIGRACSIPRTLTTSRGSWTAGSRSLRPTRGTPASSCAPDDQQIRRRRRRSHNSRRRSRRSWRSD